MNYFNRTWMEISLSAATENFNKIKSLNPNKKLFAVVKANGYGHGAIQIARLFEDLGADGFAVSNIFEALELRESGIKKEILILGYTPFEHADILIENNISQSVYSFEYAKKLNELVENRNGKISCHIKLDTGMNRLGFEAKNGLSEASKEELELCKGFENLDFKGVFTHFSTADSNEECDISFADGQYESFKKCVCELEDMGYSFEYVHSDNSAATLTRKDDVTNTIRPGIILYGYLPSPDLKADISLTPVLSLKSVVSMVKNIKKGDSVSYGRIFTAERDMKIATVPVGYADGYPRYLSDKGYALINGKRVRIIGRICMDQMMLDVSELDNVKIGDVVTLIGKDTGEKITAEDIAELGNTISYEIICGFTPRVERKYL